MREHVWVGLDLGLKRTHVCVIDDNGKTLHEQDCETHLLALQDALSVFSTDRIRLISVEAGSDTNVVRKLRGAGFPVAMFEARKASKFLKVRRNKTDKGDARGLADLGRIGRNTVSQVYLKTPECEQLRSLLVMRKKLVSMRVAIEGALRSRLALCGRSFKLSRGAGSVRQQVEGVLAGLKADEGLDLTCDVAPLVDVSDSLRRYLKKLNVDLEARARANEVCRLLMEVPGVGPICALSFFTAVEDPSRFRKAADVAAYLGLTPKRSQSGKKSRTEGITKTGSRLTRTHLVTAAMVFGTRGPDCALKDWFVELHGRIGPMRARVALARKLSIILLTMWKNRAHFDPSPSTRSPGD